MKTIRVARGVDAGGEVGAGAALLVHDADLDGVARQAERVLDQVEQAHGQGDLVGAMHLGLDDIDRAGRAVAARALEVVQGGGDGDQGVEHGLVDRLAVVGATMSVVMWWPTLRTSIRLRPGRVSSPPPGAV